MKKFSVLFLLGVIAAACSSDDDATPVVTCDCEKHIQVYNDAMGAYETTDVVPFGNDCSTDTNGQRATVDGVTFSIECDPVE